MSFLLFYFYFCVYIMIPSLVVFFMGFLSIWMRGSLIPVPSFGLFSICFFVLSNSNVLVFENSIFNKRKNSEDKKELKGERKGLYP